MPSSSKTRSAEVLVPETDFLGLKPISAISLEVIYHKEVVEQMRDDLRVAMEKLRKTNPDHPLLKDMESGG